MCGIIRQDVLPVSLYTVWHGSFYTSLVNKVEEPIMNNTRIKTLTEAHLDKLEEDKARSSKRWKDLKQLELRIQEIERMYGIRIELTTFFN